MLVEPLLGRLAREHLLGDVRDEPVGSVRRTSDDTRDRPFYGPLQLGVRVRDPRLDVGADPRDEGGHGRSWVVSH